MSNNSPNITDQASSASNGTESYQWTLSSYHFQGQLWLAWKTDAPFSAAQGQIVVYSGEGFPSNPQDRVQVQRSDTDNQPWAPGLRWGTGWYCAWIAQTDPPEGPYVYVVKVIPQ